MKQAFFKFARERHQIYLNRKSGMAPPWTKDPILQEYKFTNVFRELDKTTEWFRWNVRDPMQKDPEVLLATIIFRWFNRITTGEAIFCQRMINRYTPFDDFLRHGDGRVLKTAIKSYCGDGPYFTGAYMIRSPNGMGKLEGMIDVIERFHRTSDWHGIATYYMQRPNSQRLQLVWHWLKKFECQGPFHAYEVVTDLRHTDILNRSKDIMTWANPGPGCKRGVSRLLNLGTRLTKTHRRIRPITPSLHIIQLTMASLLAESNIESNWPSDWPRWEMREVEHTLCEWDKYERLRLGQGKVKGRYSPIVNHHAI